MAAVEVEEEPVATMAAEEATEESVFVKWRWVFALSTLLVALLLFGALLYLHIEQEKQQQQELQSMQLQLELGNQMAEMPSTSGKKMPINAEDYNYNNNQNTNNDVVNSDEYYDVVDYNDDDAAAADNEDDQNDANNVELVAIPSQSTINSTSLRSATETAAAVNVSVLSPVSEQHQFMACHNEDLQLAASATPLQHLPSENCLQCICETSTECRPVKCSSGVYCGLFRISMPYWMDAGRPRLPGVDNASMADDEAHLQCVNDPCCAARTVTEFVQKYARDCNHDGKIDCSDHAALHILGAGGCLRQALSPIFEFRLAKCMARLF